MNERISADLLFRLRNHIPIDELIQNALEIPTKNSEGFMRFLCPECQEFRTATNKKTNLGRCFLCQRNFNCIDLVMIVRGYNFKQTVKYLQNVLSSNQSPAV